MTFDPGNYHIYASAPAYRVDVHKTRLRQLTPVAVTIVVGSSEYSTDASSVPDHSAQTRSFIDHLFTVAATATMRIEHQCSDSQLTNGFGRAAGFGEVEVYTEVWIIRLGET